VKGVSGGNTVPDSAVLQSLNIEHKEGILDLFRGIAERRGALARQKKRFSRRRKDNVLLQIEKGLLLT
jgi:hypothetical protein